MPAANGHGPASDVGKVALYLRVSSEEQRDREWRTPRLGRQHRSEHGAQGDHRGRRAGMDEPDDRRHEGHRTLASFLQLASAGRLDAGTI